MKKNCISDVALEAEIDAKAPGPCTHSLSPWFALFTHFLASNHSLLCLLYIFHFACSHRCGYLPTHFACAIRCAYMLAHSRAQILGDGDRKAESISVNLMRQFHSDSTQSATRVLRVVKDLNK